jgi:hypothetical protein
MAPTAGSPHDAGTRCGFLRPERTGPTNAPLLLLVHGPRCRHRSPSRIQIPCRSRLGSSPGTFSFWGPRWGTVSPQLLSTQRLHRIDASCATRGDIRSKPADEQEHKTRSSERYGIPGTHLKEHGRKHASRCQRCCQACNRTHACDNASAAQHLGAHATNRGSQRDPNTNLARLIPHERRHHAVQSDRRKQ